MVLRLAGTALLAAVAGLCGTAADTAVAAVLKRSLPDAKRIRILVRTTVEPETDLVIAFASGDAAWRGIGDGEWWRETTLLGIFLQRREKPDLVYRIAVEKGLPDGDCLARVERATATDVVISCTPEKGSRVANRKFVYDVRAKQLIRQFDYGPYPVSRAFAAGGRVVLVGSNFERLVALEWSGSAGFRMLTGREEGRWTARVKTNALVRSGEPLLVEPEMSEPVAFGSGGRFRLMREEQGSLVIEERTGTGRKRYEIPKQDYAEFSAARPRRVKDGYTREATTVGGSIGPWQLAEGRVWFGKNFYDSEGSSGVGGFGYFDAAERRYRMFAPPEVQDYSVSAILVEAGVVWLGLVHCGEWGSYSGGLVRFDRATEQVQRFELRDVVGQIVRSGDRLILATEFGTAILEDGRLRRFFLDQTTDGRVRVVEAVVGLP